MKQIIDKLNKIAKKIDESVEIPQTDLIIDSLDAITKAYGGTPNDSNLIVDKLEDIYNNIGPAVSGNIEITENGENINVAPYATATVNVAGGGVEGPFCVLEIENTAAASGKYYIDSDQLDVNYFMCFDPYSGYYAYNLINYEFSEQETKTIYTIPLPIMQVPDDPTSIISAIAIVILDSNVTITDLVNCTVSTTATGRYLQITDSTEYAHAKISIQLYQ